MNLSTLNDDQLQHEIAQAAANDDQRHLAALTDECDRRDRLTPKPPSTTATLHQAALWYASQGIACFPLKPGSKQPATRHGFKEATIDQGQINQWWQANPAHNIGLATGLLFDVADLDGWEAVDTWAALDDRPETLGVVVTPRREGGGRHHYVPVTGQGNRTGLMPKIDWRGEGGYVVAPPSVLPEGQYWWLRPLRVDAL